VVLFLMAVAMGVVAAATFFWPYMPDPAISARSIEEGNVAANAHMQTRTDETKSMYRMARQQLKKTKKDLKNTWLLDQLKQCNDPMLPGGKDKKSGKAMWTLAQKPQRGVGKWRP
jgi:hypothetical protein